MSNYLSKFELLSVNLPNDELFLLLLIFSVVNTVSLF